MLILAQLPTWATGLLVTLFLVVCVMMILTVLIQRPSGGGLSGAFGSGAGSGQTAFGAKTGDALTIATITIFLVYLLFAVGLNFAARPSDSPAAPAATGAVPPATGTGAAPAAATGATGPTTPEQPEPLPPPPPAATGGATGPTGAAPLPAAPEAPTGAPAPTGPTGATGPG